MTLSKKLRAQITILISKYSPDNQAMILKEIRNYITKDSPKPRTITVRYSNIKGMFKKAAVGNKEFLNKIKPEDSITQHVMAENQIIRDEQQLIPITRKMIQTIMRFEHASDIFNIAIYLLFVSGRRTSELFECTFKMNSNSPYIVVEGLKKRNDNIDCSFKPLVNVGKFFKIFCIFNKLKQKTNLKALSRNLTRRIKKVLNGDEYKPHMLRGFYIYYSFHFRNHYNKKINTFIRDGLCHQTIDASLNYTQYKIMDDLDRDIVR